MLAQILDRLRSGGPAATEGAADAYFKLCRDLASGAEVDTTEAIRITREADRSAEDLEADVEVLRQRSAWQAQYRGLADADHRAATAQAALDAAKRKLDEAVAKYQPAIDQAYRELQAAETDRQQRRTLEARLRDRVPPWVVRRLRELETQRSRILSESADLREAKDLANRRLSEHFAAMRIHEAKAASAKWPSDRQAATKEVERVRERVEREQEIADRVGAQLRPFETQLAAIESELREIHRKAVDE